MRKMIVLSLLCIAGCEDPVATTAPASAAHCEASEGRGLADAAYMQKLRQCAWRLLEPLTGQTEGLPDEKLWRRSDLVVPDSDPAARSGLRPAKERGMDERPKVAEAQEPDLYEMTFFNGVAQRFISDNALDQFATTDSLLGSMAREVQLPAGSAVLKTFWYVLKQGQTVGVRKWDWTASVPRVADDPEELVLDVKRLEQLCVSETPKDGCLVAEDAFYTIRVRDESELRCVKAICPGVDSGDLLILVGLHIASKEMPEWLWSTFWWQGSDAPAGDTWTCASAQRPSSIDKAPWTNYAMNVTASFQQEKPPVQAGDACGMPGAIGDGRELMAAYNPFVEARERNGLISNCLDCHSRASTSSEDRFRTSALNRPIGPEVREFEGHVRLDYLWSLRRSLRPTLPIRTGNP